MDARSEEITEFVRELRGTVPRVSFRRMVRSSAFEELCGYYTSSRRAQFTELAGKLESTFYR